MSLLEPFETLYEAQQGADLPLPPPLAALYNRLQFPTASDRPYIIGNFVTTLDGVVSLNVPGQLGGSEISGANQQFAPEHPILGTLIDVKRAGSHLFLRYAFEQEQS